ncbi:MAG: ABC transporter ATP-binding protein [Candidatus Omnitrophica bacterium]|nr:ABC transporter ATP-binding protein [Candidatus Omnitrophota bacterium]
MKILLTARSIHKKYQQGTESLHILKGVDLDIHEGQVLALVGPSGAGKSTLLHILGGLDKPTQGDVILDGRNFYNANDIERSRMRNLHVGFVFQFYHLLPEFTALENVSLPALISDGIQKAETVYARGKELLDRVGLTHRIAHRPQELSGGEQQRVAIARALINKPKIVFCDEPTGNLDSKSGDAIIDLLLELNKLERQTLVMVTHDSKIAARSNQVMHIIDGKFEENG